MRTDHDVAVVGAGPIGCAAAIAFAQRGARVLLLEANPRASERFAGEWIHPSGVEILEKLGLTGLEAFAENGPRRGFVVHPNDGSDPIVLSYPDGATGVSFDHSKLVCELRRHAVSNRNIDYVAPAKLVRLEPTPAYLHRDTGTMVEIRAERIVAADGRRSGTRRMLGLPDSSVGISFMAGLTLENMELPLEGFGHVMSGLAGPIMSYRIAPNTVRMCLDVPASASKLRRDTDALYDAVAPALPAPMAKALADSLKARKPIWMETRFQTRTVYGRGNVMLVGDAVGCTHPLTAVGISLGLKDVEAVVDSVDAADYGVRRRASARVPEMLSNALYRVFSDPQYDTEAIRQSMFHIWRNSAAERRRTMGLLAATDVRGHAFATSFFRIGFRAARKTVGGDLRDGRWRRAQSTVGRFASWSTWPIAGLLPRYRKIPPHLRASGH
ncbi:MAG: FAD-dependent oxidoreductase [Pseudomonadota bacterium]